MFPKQTTALDPTEQTAQDTAEIANGTLSAPDILMRDHGMDRDAAIERYTENVRLRNMAQIGGLRQAIATSLAERR